MHFGDHDQLDLTPAEANELSTGFWGIYLASKYPDGYLRAVIRESYDDFQADFVTASTALVKRTELYLGAVPPVTRPCPCQECKQARDEQP